jgi:two-component system CheB/CheR fusion protein
VIVSGAGAVTFANLPARALFGVGQEDLGRPLTELGLAHTPVNLVPAVEEAMREGRSVALGEIRFAPPEGEERLLDVTVVPLLLSDGGPAGGASVVFEDVTRYASLRRELEGNRRDLELAYEELQSTIDELETTNEELQSAKRGAPDDQRGAPVDQRGARDH